MVTRLYTEDYFLKQMPGEGIPEMQRSNLVSTVIQVQNLFSSCHLAFPKNSQFGMRYTKPQISFPISKSPDERKIVLLECRSSVDFFFFS